tara:strand:- start:790 stop:1245 length:456 start_codon:yes stop_codon:yes gene_type:complete
MKIIKVSKSSKKNFYSIDDVCIGDTHQFKIKISKIAHNNFKKFTGDKSPIHTKIRFCKKNGYKKNIGYAFLLTNILSNIFGMHFPGGTELCLKQVCNFKKPFYVNDTLNILLRVIQKNINAKLITVSIIIKNQKKNIIFEGETIFQLILNE